jgi:hypothetical protein
VSGVAATAAGGGKSITDHHDHDILAVIVVTHPGHVGAPVYLFVEALLPGAPDLAPDLAGKA